MPPKKKKKSSKKKGKQQRGTATATATSTTIASKDASSVNPNMSEASKSNEESSASCNGDGYDPFLDEAIIDIQNFVIPPRPECPICFLPFPFEKEARCQFHCCGKCLCRACLEESFYGRVEQRGPDCDDAQSCPFCRELPPQGGIARQLKKLVKQGNFDAMVSLAWITLQGEEGVVCDPKRAIELYHMAARAGSSQAFAWLGDRYLRGDIVVKQDINKAKRLYSAAARLAEPHALYQLGKMRVGDVPGGEDFVYYSIASASMGFRPALDEVRNNYVSEFISKEAYTYAMRSYQAVHEEINSESRARFNVRLAEHRTIDDIGDMLGLERLD